MGKKQKRGKAGNAAQYLTRNQAIKKLQLRLSEFRRLCILKGVHPREPKRKVKGANKTYYHVKDINWLAHEPLIQNFRAVKVHERRVSKARAKANFSLARRLMRAKPGYKLDHLVRERYPSFIDALRDLDDPLTLLHLFATLPAEGRLGISASTVDKCRRLVLEWNAYVARTSSLRRVFVSVKGFYYQAEVAGCSVTWLVPHQLAQVLPADVDFTVMLTFLEFYATLVQFVMFKLYHNLGLRYPPVADKSLEAAAAGLAGIMKDIAGLAADEQQQQGEQQQQQDGTAAAAAALPDVVQRLGTLGKKLQQLQQQQQQGDTAAAAAAAAEDESEELPEIDSGCGDDSDSEADSEADAAEDEEEEEEDEEGSSAEESEEDAAGSEEEQQQQQQQQEAAGDDDDAAGVSGAAVAGGGLGSVDPDDDAGLCSVLLQGCVFWLAREVPREPLLLMIRAFGGTAAWEGPGSPLQEADEAITHQIVDRPTQGHKFLSRAYVQPQWLFDSINHRVLLPAELYAPGKVPPPHLSPFVDNEAEGYTPEFARTIKQLQEAARAARRAAAGLATEAAFLQDGSAADAAAAAAAAAPGEDDAVAEKVYQKELAKELRAAQGVEAGDADQGSEEEEGSEQGSDEEEDAAAAAAGKKRKAAAAGATGKAAEEDEEAAMADIMMTRKNRKLYARINRAIEGKAERVAALEQRKAKLAGQQQQQQQVAAGGRPKRQRKAA
uniref:Pescadillo homolog n=2 Tax=Tetradesmus obliquus TaxID=3088 RepID=A0A383W116_TETOB|eukprot:jgi/Sobl393_1/11795/SZX70356.1